MNHPDWFVIIKEWRDRGMGRYGVSLPFVYGALVMKTGKADLREIVEAMIREPVSGYVTEVTWCPDVSKAPILRATREDDPDRVKFQTISLPNPQSGKPALVFDNDLVRMWGNTPDKLVDALVTYASVPVTDGNYSRHYDDKTAKHYWGDFSEKERAFIRESIMAPEKSS